MADHFRISSVKVNLLIVDRQTVGFGLDSRTPSRTTAKIGKGGSGKSTPLGDVAQIMRAHGTSSGVLQ
jgi:hypothetical protein